mmetsp:Transcript_26527/g.85826  ORF Transcript_26527/g.85826 Transcript_26527/m.85826 type:complete len:619 (-) Transcript_26527:2420-4276(-)
MGQQTSASFTPFTAWKKKETEADLEQLAFRLRQTEAMLADPDKLARDCDFHFGRAGLDARGELRRVELRRLLWTFAHSLGSSDLTWEAIEASAVIGTVEPHVPSVTQDQFFRCTLKTVHLVAAELRDKHREMEGRIRLQYARQHGDLRSAGPWVGQKQGSPPSPSASSRGSSVSRGSSASSRGSRGSPHGAGPEREAQPPTMAFPSKGKGRGKISQMGAGLGKGAPAAPYDFEVADAGPMVLLRGEAAEPSMLSRSPDESTEPRPAPAFDPPSAASPSPSPTGAPREPRLAPVFAPPPPSAAAAAAPPCVGGPPVRRKRPRSSSSVHSARTLAPATAGACSAASASRRFFATTLASRTSKVSAVTRRCTTTVLRWPMRCARSVACASFAGFQQRSKCTTCVAAVSVRPTPPAPKVSTITALAGSSENSRTSSSRASRDSFPWKRRAQTFAKEASTRSAMRCRVPRYCVKIKTFSRGGANISSKSSSNRAILPLFAAWGPNSGELASRAPVANCGSGHLLAGSAAGWLQVCCSTCRAAKTRACLTNFNLLTDAAGDTAPPPPPPLLALAGPSGAGSASAWSPSSSPSSSQASRSTHAGAGGGSTPTSATDRNNCSVAAA